MKIDRHTLKNIKFHYGRLGRSDTVKMMVGLYGFTVDEAVKYLKSL